MAKFTFRENTLDFAIFNMVYFNNEYQLPSCFEHTDIIIDIGAHIGSFAFACLVRGAGQVIAIEAHPENFKQAQLHLSEYVDSGQLDLQHAAVWRSDKNDDTLSLTLFPTIDNNILNTGGAEVVKNATDDIVKKISLDSLINSHMIRLLKIDCEGSEFPILLTSSLLSHVQEIVGEFHEHGNYTVHDLLGYLQSQGFTTHCSYHQQYKENQWTQLKRGHFRAIRQP